MRSLAKSAGVGTGSAVLRFSFAFAGYRGVPISDLKIIGVAAPPFHALSLALGAGLCIDRRFFIWIQIRISRRGFRLFGGITLFIVGQAEHFVNDPGLVLG